jgi:hypothetical protein
MQTVNLTFKKHEKDIKLALIKPYELIKVRGGFGHASASIPLSLKSFSNFRWYLDNT